MGNISTKKMQEVAAIRYCEEHGIVQYSLKGWVLSYNISFSSYLSNPRYTIKVIVDLRKGREVERRQLKRYDPKGVYNRWDMVFVVY